MGGMLVYYNVQYLNGRKALSLLLWSLIYLIFFSFILIISNLIIFSYFFEIICLQVFEIIYYLKLFCKLLFVFIWTSTKASAP